MTPEERRAKAALKVACRLALEEMGQQPVPPMTFFNRVLVLALCEVQRVAVQDATREPRAELARLRKALLARLKHEGVLGSTGYDTMEAHNAAVERIQRLTDVALRRTEPSV